MKKTLPIFRAAVCLLIYLFVSSASQAYAQQNPPVTLQKNGVTLSEVFKTIKDQTGLTVFYSNSLLNDDEKINVNFSRTDLSKVMDVLLKNKNLTWVISGQFITLKKKEEVTNAPQKLVQLKGLVSDDKDEVLFGATVRLKGTQIVTTTKKDGTYSITVPEQKGTLVFTFVSYATQEVVIGSDPVINVTLIPEDRGLNEVVVIGYGQSVKKDLTGAVGIANVADMQKAPVASYVDALAGRIAGVSVISGDGQPGATSQITVRGSSVTQDASPLFVIDGFPIENMDINSINPNDIESLQVLKDASSIAIYGARGSNGVIIINTKRGKEGPPRVSYTMSLGMQKDVRRLKVMDPYEFVKLQLELDDYRSTPASPVTINHQLYLNPAKGLTLDSYKDIPGIDWQSQVLQHGQMQNHTLNISAGNANTRYSISGSMYKQQGIIINTGMKRNDGKITLDQNIRKNLRLGLTGSYSSSENYGTIPAGNSIAASGFGGGVIQAMWQYRPVNGNGNQDLLNATIDSLDLAEFNNGNASTRLGDNLINPRVQAENEHRVNVYNTGMLNMFLEYSFLNHFKLKISGGYNSTAVKSEYFYNSNTQQGNIFTNSAGAIANANGINGQNNYVYNKNYLNENILTFKTKIGKNQTLDALAGFTYQYANTYGTFYRAINIPASSQDFGILSLGAGTPSTITVSSSQWQLYSYLSRVNYSISDRYLFTATARADGSSKFAYGHQWGYFPSGAFAWRFTEEPFLKKPLQFLGYGKFRVSYGAVGNNRVGDFSYLAQFAGPVGQFGYPLNNTYTRGTVPFFYGNSALTWETSKELDLGLDLSFFHDRINVAMDYYNKTTSDFLLNVTIPAFSGYSTSSGAQQFQNTGELKNEGFEFTLNTVNIRNKNFRWTTDFNISFNKGRIGSFYNGVEAIQSTWSLAGSAGLNYAWIAKTGGSIAEFYGYKFDGVYQYGDFNKLSNGTYVLKNGLPTYSAAVQPGDPKYADLNGDGVVNTSDQVTLGSPIPIHIGGISNNFDYKNFSLNVFMQWSYGNKVLNANNAAFNSTGGYFLNGNQFASYANRWTPTNPSNEIPRAVYNIKGDIGNTGGARPSSRFIEDGSFMRLKTVSLGYRLPEKIRKKLSLADLRVTCSAQNIFTLTKYSGIDPEVSTFRVQNPANSAVGGQAGSTNSSGAGNTFIQPSSTYTALVGGFDYTPYPRYFTVTLGLNATF